MVAQNILRKRSFGERITYVFKKDLVFTAAFILALASCFVSMPKVKYIDFKVIVSLFDLMLVIKAFEELKLLDKLAVSMINRCSSRRNISIVLTFLCFFTAMFITNDVALITFVPLALIIGSKTKLPMMETIIFETIAANIGSALTPMGNPQNLYIFSFYNLNALQFFNAVIIVIIAGLVWLYVLNKKLKDETINVNLNQVKIVNSKEVCIWFILFFVILLSVFRIIDYRLAFIMTCITALLMNRSLFAKVDYLLLITFGCFFVFIGNISSIRSLSYYLGSNLNSKNATYFASILMSQFISNVPCSILLSHFTNKWQALLLGVNIGGVGTLIASLASVISYKLFIKENCEEGKKYMVKFTVYNLITLVLLTIVGEFMI